MADHTNVVSGISALYLKRAHSISLISFLLVKPCVVRSLEPRWTTKNSGGGEFFNNCRIWGSSWCHCSPLIVCHLTLAERLRFLPPGWVAASSPAQKGIDDPTIQMFFRVPEKLCLD